MTINNDTQDGELVFILPAKVAYVYINVANANGPDYGYDLADTAALNLARDSVSVQIEEYDPELVGAINTIDYNDRNFNITAEVDWNLDTTLLENDIAPHVVLYDADGEFAFNLQNYLTWDEESGEWVGQLNISEDIKAGKYIIKLFIGGVELDSVEGSVSGASAPGFLFFSLSLALATLIFIRKKK